MGPFVCFLNFVFMSNFSIRFFVVFRRKLMRPDWDSVYLQSFPPKQHLHRATTGAAKGPVLPDTNKPSLPLQPKITAIWQPFTATNLYNTATFTATLTRKFALLKGHCHKYFDPLFNGLSHLV
jgi:hypothetical protein